MAGLIDSPDLISDIRTDHRQVLAVFDKLERTRDVRRQRTLTADVIDLLMRHRVAEELHLHPLVCSTLPDGAEILRHDVAKRAITQHVIERLERLDPTAPEFDTWLRNLMAVVRHHIEDEESDLLPRLRSQCNPNQLAQLGVDYRRTRQATAQEPHPSAQWIRRAG